MYHYGFLINIVLLCTPYLQMESLTNEVQAVFQDFVSTKGGWLSDATKALADAKIRNIVHSIGYPDFILNDELLQEEVSGVRVIDRYTVLLPKAKQEV